MKVGILGYHGSVAEHLEACRKAATGLGVDCEITIVRDKEGFNGLDGLIIPGGESTHLKKMIEKDGVVEEIGKIKAVFGTCAGAILMSRSHLGLMDIEIERNAYGSQLDSFEKEIETSLGKTGGVFIRAPKIKKIGDNVKIIAKNGEEITGVEQEKDGKYYLALTFHPELVTSEFHKYFLKKLLG